MFALDRYLAPLDLRSQELRAANEAAREQSLIRDLRYWTDEAGKAEPNSDYWHECMDELDAVKTMLRKS